MCNTGKKISIIRKARKLTQKKLAELANVDYNTLKKTETGKIKNPSADFVARISSALHIDSSSLIEQNKPNTHGTDILPFLQLTPENFESLIRMLLEQDAQYSDVQSYGGRGDKQRDIIAREVISGQKAKLYTLFQAKRHTTTTLTTLKQELTGIKKHFFSQTKSTTPIENIVFCLADSPSPYIKDTTKELSISLGLPEPIFWDNRDLNIKCHLEKNKDVIRLFFNGHISEIKEITKESYKAVNQLEKKVEKINKTIMDNTVSRVPQSYSIEAKDDAEMQKARRLIQEKNFTEAKEILLGLQKLIEKSNHSEKLKKLYNNLGVCFCQESSSKSIEKGIEFLNKSLDLDSKFLVPKQNLIEIIVRTKRKQSYNTAIQYTKELLSNNPNNLNHIAIFIHLLHVNNQLDDAASYLDSISNIKEKCSLNEGLCVSVAQLFFHCEDLNKTHEYLNIGLKNFPDSINLHELKGFTLMLEIEKGGCELRNFDIVPLYFKSQLASEAAKHFRYARDGAKNIGLPQPEIDRLSLELYSALSISGRDEKIHISSEQLNKAQQDIKLSLDLRSELVVKKSYRSAFNIAQNIINNSNNIFETTLDTAEKFYRYGAPEYVIKLLYSINDEAKEKKEFRYWALLSVSYAIIDKKNDMLRTMEEAKSIFYNDERNYKYTLSHYNKLLSRYKNQSESDRFVNNIFELQSISPNKKIIQPVKAIEEDGSISQEIKNFFVSTQKIYDNNKEIFLSQPVPIYFLEIIFSKPFSNAIKVPRDKLDFDFVLPYNSMSIDFSKTQMDLFKETKNIIIDYCSLLNFTRSGQLGLFKVLEKNIMASEYLLFKVQDELVLNESQELKDAWEFLRSEEVKLLPHYNYDNNEGLLKTKELFDEWGEWIIQSIAHCSVKKACFLTDDLRLSQLVNSENKISTLNSFIFFNSGQQLHFIDKKQYSLVLGDLAELLFHFIPFDGEDLLNIVLDDLNKIRCKTILTFNDPDTNPELRISVRTYHLLNQHKLPGADIGSFLKVCYNFLVRLCNLSVLVEDKINWTLFITNFFYDSENMTKGYIHFAIHSWILLIKTLPDDQKKEAIKKAELIQNQSVRETIMIHEENYE